MLWLWWRSEISMLTWTFIKKKKFRAFRLFMLSLACYIKKKKKMAGKADEIKENTLNLL